MTNSENNNIEHEFSNKGKYNLVLCELFQPNMHGFVKFQSDPTVIGHYLVISTLDPTDEEDVNDMVQLHSEKYLYLNQYCNHRRHPTIRNYRHIVSSENYIQPQIAECIYLKGDEYVAIIKTFWIKIIQRAWKKVYKNREMAIKQRYLPENIIYWQIHGKWKIGLPTIHGMLFQKSK